MRRIHICPPPQARRSPSQAQPSLWSTVAALGLGLALAHAAVAGTDVPLAGDDFLGLAADRAEIGNPDPWDEALAVDGLDTDLERAAYELSCSSESPVCTYADDFVPTKKRPTLSLTMTPEPGDYHLVKAHVKVQVNGWNKIHKQGAHAVLYLAVNRNKWLLANVFLRGPNGHLLVQRHGWCPKGCFKAKEEAKLKAELGTTYEVDFEYRAEPGSNGLVQTTVSQGGKVLATIKDQPCQQGTAGQCSKPLHNIAIKPGDQVRIGLSNPFANSYEEPASLNWKYSDLRVDFVMDAD